MKSNLKGIAGFLFILTLLFAQAPYSEILSLPWGAGDGAAGLREIPDGCFGPMSFSVQDENVYLLDSPNKRLKEFTSRNLVRQFELPNTACDDFLWQSPDLYYILTGNSVIKYQAGQPEMVFRPQSPRQLITKLTDGFPGQFAAVINHAELMVVDQTGMLRSPNDSVYELPVTKYKNKHEIAVQFGEKTGFTVQSDNYAFGSSDYLGSTPTGNIYIYLEFITRQVPLRVQREIRLYTPAGEQLASISIPSHSHAYSFRPFFIDGQGDLYHLLTSRDGIHIIRWELGATTDPLSAPLSYPAKFLEFHHYNLELPAENEEVDDALDPTLRSREALAVNRTQSLETGDSYVQHTWTATSANLTGGTITVNGVEVCTPEWVQVGTNSTVPYKWGGFNTLSGFDDGIAAGKYAGDKATSGVSSSAIGVDCSGFVSRCWNLSSHYSTAMMPSITNLYSDWSDLKPADAVHKVGHVRLFVEHINSNSLLVVEAAGRDWRCNYHSYYHYDLTNYDPRYYPNMQESTLTERPELSAVTSSSGAADLTWTLADSSNLLGFAVDYYTAGTWNRYPADSYLAADDSGTTINPATTAAVYYNVCSIATDESESGSSDTYGARFTGSDNKVLIVDGFDRISGSYDVTTHSFVQSIGNALNSSGLSFDACSNDAILASTISLNDYNLVIWLLGDESTDDETFSDSEQNLVKSFLEQGGNLFVSGSELAWDLDNKGSTTDKSFIKNYLKVALNNDDSGYYTVNGAIGSAFEGLTVHFDNGSYGVYAEDYPDSYTVQTGAETVLSYGNGQVAAAGFKGTVPNGTASAGVVVMGFPVETIYTESEQADLLLAVLDYLDINLGTIDEPSQPDRFILHGNYPNPFNSHTVFKFTINQASDIQLTVYNLLGQQVGLVFKSRFESGQHSLVYNASSLSSGTYFYSMTSGSMRKTGKFLLIK